MQWLILTNIFQKWAEVDPVFENIAVKFPGVRILKQDPVENLFSFICSSNNNIQRISGVYNCKSFFFEIFKLKYMGFSHHYSFFSFQEWLKIYPLIMASIFAQLMGKNTIVFLQLKICQMKKLKTN